MSTSKKFALAYILAAAHLLVADVAVFGSDLQLTAPGAVSPAAAVSESAPPSVAPLVPAASASSPIAAPATTGLAAPATAGLSAPTTAGLSAPTTAGLSAPATTGLSTPASSEPLATFLERLALNGWKSVAGAPTDSNPDQITMLKEFGCKASFSKSFQRGQRRIDVVVYSFSSSQGAYAAYGLLRRGSSTFVTRGDASSEDDQSISVWKDKYFISFSGTSQDDEESKLAISDLSNQLTNAISTHGQIPLVIAKLPPLDRVRGSERVVMGPVSARRFFPAPFLNVLGLPRSIGGGLADYQYQAPFRERMKLLVVDYGSESAAAQAFAKYVDALQEQHQNISPADVPSRALFKLANSFLLCELRSHRVLLISGARKRSAPIMLARQVL